MSWRLRLLCQPLSWFGYAVLMAVFIGACVGAAYERWIK